MKGTLTIGVIKSFIDTSKRSCEASPGGTGRGGRCLPLPPTRPQQPYQQVASGTICRDVTTPLGLFDLRAFIFEKEKSNHICFSLMGPLKMTLGTLIKSLVMIASRGSNT